MVNIPEYSRDESKDYLVILRSLNEIPFPVGKNLLIDFLAGDMGNKSILKNNMYDFHNFGELDYLDKGKISGILENLIINKMIDLSSSTFNKFSKVLTISIKGQEELLEPTLNKKRVSEKYNEVKTIIKDSEIKAFKELDDFLKNFNMEQKKAIISKGKKILCIAGAGSGKTTVLTKRIEFLNKMKRIRGDEILAITFTRKAKLEMEKRLEKLGIKSIVETFNSFSEKILLKNSGRVYGRKVRLATFQDQMMAVLRALDNLGLDMERAIEKYFTANQKKNKSTFQLQNMFVNDCFSVLEYFKATQKSFEEFTKDARQKDYENSKMIFDIVKFLEKHMVTNGLRTYGDQINDTINFFKINPKFIPKFQHILVDEFQDVNKNQVELLDLLNSENLFCVGDPRQSIFGWRGSDVNYILNFQKKYPGSEIVNLKKNYRSNNSIVSFMNGLIKDMNMPDLENNFEGEKEMKLVQFSEEVGEFNFIRAKILNSNLKRKEIFVLARTNRQLLDLSNILKQAKIKHVLKNDDLKKGIEAKEDEVTLATIHSIKGLEAELVFVIGCNQNNFPCKSTDHPVIENIKMYEYDREEEERRLFYVAVSRAKNKLYLTYSGKKHTYFINEEIKKELDKINF